MEKLKNQLRIRYTLRIWRYIIVGAILCFLGVILMYIFDYKMKLPIGITTVFGSVYFLWVIYLFYAIYYNAALFCKKKVSAKILRYDVSYESTTYDPDIPSNGGIDYVYWDLEYIYRKRTYHRLLKSIYYPDKVSGAYKETVDIYVCPFCPKLIRIRKDDSVAVFTNVGGNKAGGGSKSGKKGKSGKLDF